MSREILLSMSSNIHLRPGHVLTLGPIATHTIEETGETYTCRALSINDGPHGICLWSVTLFGTEEQIMLPEEIAAEKEQADYDQWVSEQEDKSLAHASRVTQTEGDPRCNDR